MKKTLFATLALVLLVGVAIVLTLSTANAAFIQPTETLLWDPTKAYNGYTAFTANDGTNYLINMEGRVVKSWPSGKYGNSGFFIIAENGNILKMINGAPGVTPTGPGGGIEEHTWDGKVLWQWLARDGKDTNGDGNIDTGNTFKQHHEFRRIWNKALGKYTYLVGVWIQKGPADALKLGGDPQYSSGWAKGWSPCGIMEVVPNYTKVYESGGDLDADGPEIVWMWSFSDHFVTKVDNGSLATTEFKDAYGRLNAPVTLVAPGKTLKDYPGKLNINGVKAPPNPAGPAPDWIHLNSFDYDDATGHIAVNAQRTNEFFVIDHDGTFVKGDPKASFAKARGPAGDFLYRFGSPYLYDAGTAPSYMSNGNNQITGAHNIQWIRAYLWEIPKLATDTWPDPRYYTKSGISLPGAGNFLLFDNENWSATNHASKLVEINPRIGAGGILSQSYVDPPVAGYVGQASRQIVWSFSGRESEFYSNLISSVQRLPNGNTFSDAGDQGHFIQVTPDKNVVWEYISPVYRIAGQTAILGASPQGSYNLNSVFRAHHYGPDHPGLAGKNLTPGHTITGRIPVLTGANDKQELDPVYTGFGLGSTGTVIGGGAGGVSGGTSGGSGY